MHVQMDEDQCKAELEVVRTKIKSLEDFWELSRMIIALVIIVLGMFLGIYLIAKKRVRFFEMKVLIPMIL